MKNFRTTRFWASFCWLTVSLICASNSQADNLTLKINGQSVELVGEILIEAQDKSLYFRSHDGKIWFVKPDQIEEKIDNDEAINPISKEELGAQLLAELPAGFKIYETKHYVIAYQNEPVFARWIGSLYDARLYKAFEFFWQRKKKLPLEDPQYPLVAIIFGSAAEYNQHVTRELGSEQSMIAYYNLQTNRVTMYDLTAEFGNRNQQLDNRRIDQILQTPAAIPMVATIIHEGTHQLIFNRGVQTRFAESPLWLNEGLAIYFETPALDSTQGWRAPGLVNDQRMNTFRNYFSRRPADSLKTMIELDEPFQSPETAGDRYAEAWAFNHYLLNRRSKEYVEYLKYMATKKALIEDSAETRLMDFQQFFGTDMELLDRQFIDYVRRLR